MHSRSFQCSLWLKGEWERVSVSVRQFAIHGQRRKMESVSSKNILSKCWGFRWFSPKSWWFWMEKLEPFERTVLRLYVLSDSRFQIVNFHSLRTKSSWPFSIMKPATLSISLPAPPHFAFPACHSPFSLSLFLWYNYIGKSEREDDERKLATLSSHSSLSLTSPFFFYSPERLFIELGTSGVGLL